MGKVTVMRGETGWSIGTTVTLPRLAGSSEPWHPPPAARSVNEDAEHLRPESKGAIVTLCDHASPCRAAVSTHDLISQERAHNCHDFPTLKLFLL